MALLIRIKTAHLFQNLIFTKYTYTNHQYGEKLSKISYEFCLYLQILANINLVFHTIRSFHDVMSG